ncbi:hypothetical protein BgiBS90_001210 [Biomphalaria glabrata]|nr:hypothetical protein BgiBS90_001210 [Biomphalaria glabrata]
MIGVFPPFTSSVGMIGVSPLFTSSLPPLDRRKSPSSQSPPLSSRSVYPCSTSDQQTHAIPKCKTASVGSPKTRGAHLDGHLCVTSVQFPFGQVYQYIIGPIVRNGRNKTGVRADHISARTERSRRMTMNKQWTVHYWEGRSWRGCEGREAGNSFFHVLPINIFIMYRE